MKTRKQLNSNKTACETNNNVHQEHSNFNESSSITTDRSPSPPRLRDRRSSSIECKPLIASAAFLSSSPSPPVGSKRPSTVPTRILPRRSCGRTSSLLLGNQSSLSATTSSCSNKSISTTTLNCKSPDEQASPKNDTHDQPSSYSHSLNQASNEAGITIENHELLDASRNANIKNYSRDVPLTRSATLPKHVKVSDNPQTNNHSKTKLVRISLPDAGTGDLLTRPNIYDKNRYMFTVNGLRKIETVASEDETVLRNELNTTVGNDSGKGGVGQIDLSRVTGTKTFKVLIGVTGSVATIKLVELVKKLKSMFPRPYTSKSTGNNIQSSINIKIVMTQNSKHFASKEKLIEELDDPNIDIYDDSDEWASWKKIGDPVLHIEHRKWADLCLIAPLDANTMAKLANGICDNLLTCIVRAWDITKPLIYCPAMNVHMYNHPITREQMCKLQSYGYLRVDCVEKRLACGDVGIGGMASVDSIAEKVVDSLVQPVARKISLSRPLLNQQPTYPIISTSAKDTESSSRSNLRLSSSISDQILNRFRTNNQITIHAVPRHSRPNLAEPSLKRTRVEKSGEYYVGNERDQNESLVNNLAASTNGRQRTVGVTSVQNMRAMVMDNGSMELADDEEYNPVEDDVGFDFDPSRLLEQTMVTEDSTIPDYEPRSASADGLCNSIDKSSPLGEDSFSKIGGLTPLFNTSKFLALCHNKERNCFTCTICKHDYKNRKSMARHLKEQHVQGNIYQCKPCGVSYKRREKLIKHNRERHGAS